MRTNGKCRKTCVERSCIQEDDFLHIRSGFPLQSPAKQLHLKMSSVKSTAAYINEPGSDKRDHLAIKVKIEILIKKERPSCCLQLQKI